jgi:hypothetical protein
MTTYLAELASIEIVEGKEITGTFFYDGDSAADLIFKPGKFDNSYEVYIGDKLAGYFTRKTGKTEKGGIWHLFYCNQFNWNGLSFPCSGYGGTDEISGCRIYNVTHKAKDLDYIKPEKMKWIKLESKTEESSSKTSKKEVPF